MAVEHEDGGAEANRSPMGGSPSLAETQGGDRRSERTAKLAPGRCVGLHLILRELGPGGMANLR